MQNCIHTSDLVRKDTESTASWFAPVKFGWAWVSVALVELSDVIASWHDRMCQRRALMGLSDAMLKDIGINRADAQEEFGKPFWRG